MPRSWIALALSASLVTACQKTETPAPRAPRAAGESCLEETECVHGLTCFGGKCLQPSQAEARREKLALLAARARQREEQRRERELLQQSGAAAAVPAEQPPPGAEPPTPEPEKDRAPGTVRVATTSGNAPIFAACRADERLIGGGCRVNSTIDASVRASHPSHFRSHDTLGGRWNCDGESKYTMIPLEAFALCQLAPAR